MKFEELGLPGAFLISLEHRQDDRGFFARSFCKREFDDHGLNPKVVQCNLSYNLKKGTLRGMHYQVPPHGEAKLVRCIAGSIFDVMIDLRPESPTYRKWEGVNLSSRNRRAVYVPERFAHGYLTLEDDTEVLYQVSEFYTPDCERGIRWNDPAFRIVWPIVPTVVSPKDGSHPDFS
jgi:dTDP-4-dehydrorhamnose 3,5-epimerase